MNKLTAEIALRNINLLKEMQSAPNIGLSMRSELFLQALEIALPILEQQEKGEMGFIRMQELLKNNQTDTYRQIENDAWIEWKGGECPVERHIEVEVKHRSEKWQSRKAPACEVDWQHRGWCPDTDIIAYRQILDDGWIDWVGGEGGEMPVDGAVRVELRWSQGGPNVVGRASNFDWANRVSQGLNSIIAYRVIENNGREG